MGKVRSLREKQEQKQVQGLEHDLLLLLVKRAGRIRVQDSELAELRAGDGVELTVKEKEVVLEFRRGDAQPPLAG